MRILEWGKIFFDNSNAIKSFSTSDFSVVNRNYICLSIYKIICAVADFRIACRYIKIHVAYSLLEETYDTHDLLLKSKMCTFYDTKCTHFA